MMEINYAELGLILTALRIYRKYSLKTLKGLRNKFGEEAITNNTETRIKMLEQLEEMVKKLMKDMEQ